MVKAERVTLVKRGLSAVVLVVVGLACAWWWSAGVAVPESVEKGSNLDATSDRGVVGVFRHGRYPAQAWSVINGRLVPGRLLRERFDSYLPVGPGVSLVDVRLALARDAVADVGEPMADQVLAVWDRYARLQSYHWKHPYRAQDPASWQATLDEQRGVRRALLGDWASAFFSEDEALLRWRLQRWKPSAQPAVMVDGDLSAMDPTAAGGDSARQGDWSSRLEAARLEWARLGIDGSLDVGQRLFQMRIYLQQGFGPLERERVARDLELP